MITEKDLQEAIAECEGQRNPTANTCIKLAAFYIIRKELLEKTADESSVVSGFSRSGGPDGSFKIRLESDSEFSKRINGKDANAVLPLMDELMTTLQATNPRLYNCVLKKLP